MVAIINTLEKIGFLLQEDGTYIGYGANNSKPNEIIKFEFKNHFLFCSQGEDILFQIIYANLTIGTLLVLLQEFGIYHERYVYEKVDAIEEHFEEQFD